MELVTIRGLDTNVLCYALDTGFPEHKKTAHLLTGLSMDNQLALNATVLHETYHTLVRRQKWMKEDAVDRLTALLRQNNVKYLNQTKSISLFAFSLAQMHDLGGRDSLILANYVCNGISAMYTHDGALLKMNGVTVRKRELTLEDPIESRRS
jgi:predicted nucleic acid-binding protein